MSIPFRSFEKEHVAPHGWIQWKGTRVCVDLHCTCGARLHHDGDFMYFVKCAHCGQSYECDGHIVLHPIPAKEMAARKADGFRCDVISCPQDEEDK